MSYRRDLDVFPNGVVANTHSVLALLSEHRLHTTFSILGWVADGHPATASARPEVAIAGLLARVCFLQVLRKTTTHEGIHGGEPDFRGGGAAPSRLGSINPHSAPLLRHQRMMPNFWTLVERESEAAVTVHYMEEQLDSGNIVLTRRVPIKPNDSHHDSIVRSKAVAVDVLLDAVRQIGLGTQNPKPINGEDATCFSLPKCADTQRPRRMGRQLL